VGHDAAPWLSLRLDRCATGPLKEVRHGWPDLFPRAADDLEIVIAGRDAGLKAIMMKCHHGSTVSREYRMNRMVPGIKVYGGIVLNRYVGYINPAAVEASLRLGENNVVTLTALGQNGTSADVMIWDGPDTSSGGQPGRPPRERRQWVQR